MLRLIAMSCICFALRAEVVDRLAIGIGLQAITELQLDEDVRVTAFLNQNPVVRDVSFLRAAADRMVTQYLIKREMSLSHYPLPSEEEINQYLEQLRDQFGGNAKFTELLKRYALSESCLREHLALQLTTLEFVQDRFRPDVAISESDIQNSYARQSQDWETDHPGLPIPSLASSREFIQKALVAERTDRALNVWLDDSRKQVEIVFLNQLLR